jgi:3-oxoacyl-[acyl-carrier protein] reductase
MESLKNKKALITGGNQGIGRAITKGLLETGCNVFVHYFSTSQGKQELKKIAANNSCKIEFHQADLTVETEAVNCVKKAVDFLGGLDILVNNTGGLVQRRSIDELDHDFWQKAFDLNITSAMYVTRGHPGSLAYSTNKGALLTWTRALSTELAGKGIRVNAVAPGLILGTDFHKKHTTKESAKKTIKEIPLKRAGTPDDVARAVIFLASEYDGFITGATLDINGGVYSA